MTSFLLCVLLQIATGENETEGLFARGDFKALGDRISKLRSEIAADQNERFGQLLHRFRVQNEQHENQIKGLLIDWREQRQESLAALERAKAERLRAEAERRKALAETQKLRQETGTIAQLVQRLENLVRGMIRLVLWAAAALALAFAGWFAVKRFVLPRVFA